jgi:transcription initiation factor TFIIB
MTTELERNLETNECPECNGQIFFDDLCAENKCRECGLILNERVCDTSRFEKRIYNQVELENKGRVGQPITPLTPDISFNSMIKKRDIKNPNFKRAIKWNSAVSGRKRSLLIGTSELKRIAGNLSLKLAIKEKAMVLFKKICSNNMLKGRSIDGLIVACLFWACRVEQYPISLNEFIKDDSFVNIKDPKKIKKYYKMLLKEFNLRPPPVDPMKYIPRFLSTLEMSDLIPKVTQLYILLVKSNKFTICGKDPKGIIAGCIYFIAKEIGNPIRQKDLAFITRTTEVTLRSRFREIVKVVDTIKNNNNQFIKWRETINNDFLLNKV